MKAGRFVDESPYGNKFNVNPFANKRVYLSKDFIEESKGAKAFRLATAKNLVVQVLFILGLFTEADGECVAGSRAYRIRINSSRPVVDCGW